MTLSETTLFEDLLVALKTKSIPNIKFSFRAGHQKEHLQLAKSLLPFEFVPHPPRSFCPSDNPGGERIVHRLCSNTRVLTRNSSRAFTAASSPYSLRRSTSPSPRQETLRTDLLTEQRKRGLIGTIRWEGENGSPQELPR